MYRMKKEWEKHKISEIKIIKKKIILEHFVNFNL